MRARAWIVVALFVLGFVGAMTFDALQPPQPSVSPLLTNLNAPVCTTQPKRSPYRRFLLLAQAQAQSPASVTAPPKTELGPFGWLKPSEQAVAAADANPALVDGLGTLQFKVTTVSPEAQQYFNQGLRLAYGFNHAESLRAFRKSRTLDPNCAMCFWGESLVQGPNINAPMDDAAITPARTALKQAKSLSRHADSKERALIDALAKRYNRKGANNDAYAKAMKKVAAQFPDDDDIATLYAEALMDAQPWEYWTAGGTEPKGRTAEIVAVLEQVLKRSPDHAGAIHFYIHVTESSADVERAVPYALRLGQLVPQVGHLVHMPFHTFFRVGMYKEAIDANRGAVVADEAYIARAAPVGMYPQGYYPHNVHSLMVSAQMAGDGATVIESADKLGHIVSDELVRDLPFMQPIKAAPYFAHAQFSETNTILALPQPDSQLLYVTAMWRYARGVGLARSGDAVGAQDEADAILKLEQSKEVQMLVDYDLPAKELLRLADHVIRARIAQQRNDYAEAIRHFEAAVVEEDKLSYSEPAYWYYPVRQSLGATLILKGDLQKAESVLGESLVRAPNNGWALYALTALYERRGDVASARAAREKYEKAWLGVGTAPNLTQL